MDRTKAQRKSKGVNPRTPARFGMVWLKAFLNEGSPTFLDATSAAIKAGYKGGSRHSFQQIGFRNWVRFRPLIAKWLDDLGFSDTSLKIKVLELMESKETVFQKLKGAVLQADLPEGHRVVATSGTIIQTKDGDVYGDGDTLIEVDVQALGVQVKATEMALKVKGLYAPEQHEHSGAVTTVLQLTDQDRTLLRKVIDTSIKKLMEHERQIAAPCDPLRPVKQLPEKSVLGEETPFGKEERW